MLRRIYTVTLVKLLNNKTTDGIQIMKFIGVIGFLLLFSSMVSADESPICKKKLKGYSICRLAKANSEALAAYLPNKIDANTTLYGTVARDNVVTIFGYTSHTRETLKEEIGGNSTEDLMSLSKIMKEVSSEYICNSSPLNKNFINAGGVIVYRLAYMDKSPLVTYQVDKCS